jgi:hypothetical protein
MPPPHTIIFCYRYFSEDFKFQDPDVKVNGIEGTATTTPTMYIVYVFAPAWTRWNLMFLQPNIFFKFRGGRLEWPFVPSSSCCCCCCFHVAEYSKGVQKIFDQATSRAEILSTRLVIPTSDTTTTATIATNKPVITVTWRLSGGVNIAGGLTIKPYMIDTDFVIDPTTKLIVFQEDKFAIPAWDILLSALFPFVIGTLTSPPAPPVPQRNNVFFPPELLLPQSTTTTSTTTTIEQ